MPRQVATMETVSAAVEVLIAKGADPTLKAVQELTGGSYTTVKRCLEELKAKREADTALVDVPADVQARGGILVRDLYALALRDAHAAVSEPLDHAVAALNGAKVQVAEAEAEVSRLEGIEQGQASHIERLEKRVRELELGAAGLQATLQEKVSALGRAEGQYAELQAKHKESLEELAGLRASTKTAEALHGELETLRLSVQGLAGTKPPREKRA